MRRRGSLHCLRRTLAALACLSVAFLAAPGASRAADGEPVVGSVDGQPLSADDVQLHLRPAEPQVGTAPPLDARRLAWDAAVRLFLLAREARRRGLDGGQGDPAVVEARLVQRVIRDEAERHARGAAALDEATLRRFHAEHEEQFATVVAARVAAIVVADRGQAQELLTRAAAADDGAFQQLVAQHSLDAASKARGGQLAQIDRHGRGLPPALARVALALKSSGTVGLAEGEDGRYYVLRATDVQLEKPAWGPTLAARVRELLAHRERETAVDALVTRLRAAASIKLDEAALAQLALPRWDDFPSSVAP